MCEQRHKIIHNRVADDSVSGSGSAGTRSSSSVSMKNFRNRGRRSEEQVEVMQALWAEPHVTFAGKYHTIEDAGINPLPTRRRVPIWFGGHADVTMERVVKWGGGWMPLNYSPGDDAIAAFDKLREMAEAAGRDPASIGIDTRTTVGIGAEAEWRETVRFWKSCGVTHLTLGTYSGRGHLRRSTAVP